MTAGRYVYAKLAAASGVTAIVGSGDSCRIYPINIPQNQTYPAITYVCSNKPGDLNKTQKATSFSVMVTVSMWAATYTECEEMDLAVFDALDFTEGTAGGETVKGSDYLGSEEAQDIQNELFLRVATYKIWINR